jgi:hypothetical protein
MLNMDMVGRMRDASVAVLGGESAKEWDEIVSPLCAAERLTCVIGGSGYGPSDHMPFYAAGIPVLHFFTGAHSDYHKPSDDVDKINATGTAQVAALVAATTLAISAGPVHLSLTTSTAPAQGGDVRSFGASLGTIPDYSAPRKGRPGVLLAGVRPGSAADKGGIKPGDLLIKIDDHDIGSLEDFMFVLESAHPGQAATVLVDRGGKKVSLPVVFGEARR